ncbi:hypothetical protein BCR44DRAFT_365296 [Catenaria anguillulae PL171]|uniref:Uncharacterized protein n=1 Tax=Catenaria anguillulae PL171 TaxID=765915 RepID=A0A1Y2HPT3_9FUNG|nr:hypothetical protein BCR44DRAFT_365296 [Catenaria anguillulae PL171]
MNSPPPTIPTSEPDTINPNAVNPDAVNPDTVNPDAVVALTENLIEDVLCMTLKVWRRSLREHMLGVFAVDSVLPAFKPSKTLLRMIVNRYNLGDIVEFCAQGDLPTIEAFFVHGGYQDTNEDRRSFEAAEMLAPAVVHGHTHILEWWFTLAAQAEAGKLRGPFMPHLKTLLSEVCTALEDELGDLDQWDAMSNERLEDSTLVALDWLADHGRLPTLEQLGDEQELNELFFSVVAARCFRIACFLVDKYGANDAIVCNDDEILIPTAACLGNTRLLAHLMEQFPDHYVPLDTYGVILTKASAAGKAHVLHWWVDHVRARPQWVVGLHRFLSADPTKYKRLPAFDPACPEMIVAYFLEHEDGIIAEALISASSSFVIDASQIPADDDARAAAWGWRVEHTVVDTVPVQPEQARVAILDWFLHMGMVDIAQGHRLQDNFSHMIARLVLRKYARVLSWWLSVVVPGLDKRVKYSHVRYGIQQDEQMQEWWHHAGLHPELPMDHASSEIVFPIEGEFDFASVSSATNP